MSITGSIPSDGPDAVLHRIATRLKLPYAPEQITRFVAAHPRPASLLALVDVAKQIGVELKPGKTEAAALEKLEMPFVAHFTSDNGGGFAVVEDKTSSGFLLWDSVNGSHEVEVESFVAQWSGIVALIGPMAEPDRGGMVKKKVAATVAGSAEAPSVAGGQRAWPLRIFLGAIVATLIGAGIATQPSDLRLPVAGIAFVALAGLVVASAMAVAISSYTGPYSPGICARGRFIDCHSVLTSRFARIGGFALSDLGISFYAAALVTLSVTAVTNDSGLLVVVGGGFVASVPIAVVLIGIQIAMRRLCTLCLAAHTINLVGAAVAWNSVVGHRPPVSDLWIDGLFFALVFGLVLLVVVPYFKEHATLARLGESYSRMTGSPFGSLAQLTTEEPTELSGREVGVPLDGDAAVDDELVAFLHPGCGQCEPVLREMRGLTDGIGIRVFVALPPKDDRERALCEAVVAAGLESAEDGFVAAFSAAKEHFEELVRGEAVAELAPPEAPRDRARALVARAGEFAHSHVEGTPALFFNSRPFRGPISHLIELLARHRDLLPPRP